MSLSRFICRDDQEREWQLDMHRRLGPQSVRAVAVFSAVLVACLPWFNPLAVIPMVLAGAAFAIGIALTTRLQRHEPVLLTWFAVQALMTLAVVIARYEHKGGLMILLLPVVGASSGFPSRVVAVCVAYTAALMTIASLAVHGATVAHDPPLLLVPLAVLISVAIMAAAIRDSSFEHRTASVIDHLTGMLNRTALTIRTNELSYQSALTGEPVGVLVADLDGFKAINDRDGHQRGDDVLRAFAYELRKHLRAFDLAYRLGGDEFVILMPGADGAEAMELAERIVEMVRSEPLTETPMTISVGVAASQRGSAFRFEDVFSKADTALYEAKRTGRDRACSAAPPVLGPGEVAA